MASYCVNMPIATASCVHAKRAACAVAPCQLLSRKPFNGRAISAASQRGAVRKISTACRAAVDVTTGTFSVRLHQQSESGSAHHAKHVTSCRCMQPPLVGNEAPDFLAQAVFDQEFVEVSLSQYRVSSICFM